MQQSESQPFEVIFRVRYAECDAQQVVFNARYAEYADLAATEFMREVLGGYQQLIDKQMDTQVVNLTISWKQAATFDDVLVMRVQVSKVGNTSFTLDVDIYNHKTANLVAQIQLIYVMVDTLNYQKKYIPEDLRLTLLAGASGKVVNLSGVN